MTVTTPFAGAFRGGLTRTLVHHPSTRQLVCSNYNIIPHSVL